NTSIPFSARKGSPTVRRNSDNKIPSILTPTGTQKDDPDPLESDTVASHEFESENSILIATTTSDNDGQTASPAIPPTPVNTLNEKDDASWSSGAATENDSKSCIEM